MCDNSHDVVEGKQGVTLDLGVDVLALRAQRQQLDEVDVVHELTAVVGSMALGPHQLDEHLERGAVVVEQKHLLTHIHQL